MYVFVVLMFVEVFILKCFCLLCQVLAFEISFLSIGLDAGKEIITGI